MDTSLSISLNIRNSCLFLLLAFCCILRCSYANNEQRFQSATVVGTVYCDTCFQQKFSKASHLISGASVEVECGDGTAKSSFRKEAKTNRHGVFRVHLPVSVRHIDDIKSCSVKLIRSNEPFCAVASSATSIGLRLKSKRNGHHVFSAGFFTFKPLKQPDLCYQELKPVGYKKSDSFVEQKPAHPAFFFFPPIPFIPSPGVLPPNPILPPPALVPPILPSPPPSILPPILPSPPPSLLPPVPNIPLPLLTPPPPPASPLPPLPFPLPPNPLIPAIPPLPPNPLIPGNPSPPASPLPPLPFPLPPTPLIPGIPSLPPNPLIPGNPSPPASPLPPLPFPLPPNPLIPGNPPASHSAATSP